MKKTLLILTMLTPFAIFSQQWSWVKTNGNAQSSINSSKVKTNSSGEVYSAFTNSFQPSSVLFKRESTGGTLVWSKTIGGMNTFVEDIAVDENNNAYILGQFANNLVLPDTSFTNSGVYETFLVAYNSSGARKWVKTLPGGFLGSSFISTDNVGNLVYVATTAASSNTSTSVMKFTGAGAQIFSKTFSTTTALNNLKVDKQNNIHITGTFQNGGLNLNGTSYYPSGNTGFQYTSFVAKLNPTGDIKKVQTFPGVYLKGFGMDSTSMNYYLGGYFSDSARIGQTKIYTACNTNTNSSTICEERFLAKVDTNNVSSWAKKSFTDLYVTMDVSKAGAIYLTGKFRDTLSMDGVKLKESISSRYATFVAKISSAGIASWAVKDSGTTTTTGTFPEDIAYSANGSVYLTGTFHNFQNNSYLGQFTLPITGTVSNYFSAKLMDNAIPTSITTFNKEPNAIKIYPNPSSGTFYVHGNVTAVYNILGQKVDYKIQSTSNPVVVDINSGIGVYFIEVKSGDKRTHHKVLVQ